MTSVAASRVWRSVSWSTLAASIAVAAAAVFGSTIAAALRTPAAGCFSAATATGYELLLVASSSPRPLSVQSACIAPPLIPMASTDVFLTSACSCGTRSFWPRSTMSRWAVSRHNMLSDASASRRPAVFGRGERPLRRRRCALVGDPVDAAALMVAQRRLVGVAGAVRKALRRRVVLDDEVVPVGEPHRTVRPDLRVHGCEPLFGAGRQVPSVTRHEAGTLLLDDALADHVRRRLVDEGDAVPGTRAGTRVRCRGSDRRRRCSR